MKTALFLEIDEKKKCCFQQMDSVLQKNGELFLFSQNHFLLFNIIVTTYYDSLRIPVYTLSVTITLFYLSIITK